MKERRGGFENTSESVNEGNMDKIGKNISENEARVRKDKCSLFFNLASRWAQTTNHPHNPV